MIVIFSNGQWVNVIYISCVVVSLVSGGLVDLIPCCVRFMCLLSFFGDSWRVFFTSLADSPG